MHDVAAREAEAERLKLLQTQANAVAALVRSHLASAEHERRMADMADTAKKRAAHLRRARRYAAKATNAASL